VTIPRKLEAGKSAPPLVCPQEASLDKESQHWSGWGQRFWREHGTIQLAIRTRLVLCAQLRAPTIVSRSRWTA
jgi:hypothetical protein